MTRWLSTAVFAVVGVGLAVLLMQLASRLGFLPRFPAFGGDDDFNLRGKLFVLIVCPAFIILGAVIGYVFTSQWRRMLRAWLGVLGGTGFVLTVLRSSAGWIERIDSREVANGGVLAFFVAWPALATVGAVLATVWPRRLADERRR